jgi:transcriptional regulator with AAA-type ATPase domain
MVRLDCDRLGDNLLPELFGRGSKQGILSWLASGTLLLNNVHQVYARITSAPRAL